ncbi:hypothetical protein M514_28094 [Trichuris suis]|uniref:Uncharacterized protein n=1 Tax=Trichuris suis TaxID=68888 RepID=A0A085MR86_9BILA|nr:hypothetical protein M514_28094 [Trichuris suis]
MPDERASSPAPDAAPAAAATAASSGGNTLLLCWCVDGWVRPAARRRGSTTGPNTGGIGPKASLNHPIGISDGRWPDKSLHQLRTVMHHYPLNQERAPDLSILTVLGTGDFATIFPPEPKHFGFPEAAQRVIKGMSPNCSWASFTVTTRAVSDRLRASNFRS